LKILNWTHWDLDGGVSAIVMYNALYKHEFEHKPQGYLYLDENIKKLKKEPPCFLIVTDLNLTLLQLTEILSYDNIIKLLYIDHHQIQYTEDEINELKKLHKDRFISVVDYNKCGALLTYEFFVKKYPKIENLKTLVEATDVYDRWQTEDPKFKTISYALNDLFWHYDYVPFFTKFKEGLYLDHEDKKIALEVHKKRKKYVEDSFNNHSTIINKLLIITNPSATYNNHYTIAYPQFDYYLILKNIEGDKVEFSMRININNSINLQDIRDKIQAEWGDKYMTLGGHEKSGGLSVLTDDANDFIELFTDIVSKIDK
jgi:hypothetical protein